MMLNDLNTKFEAELFPDETDRVYQLNTKLIEEELSRQQKWEINIEIIKLKSYMVE
jgi:hypothetical protein